MVAARAFADDRDWPLVGHIVEMKAHENTLSLTVQK